jgi:uncharacterized protein YndB with AHSA1/START domain
MSDPSAETLSVIIEREIPHAPEKIWRALTQPHLIAEWLMKNDFSPVIGHRFNLRSDPHPNWNGVIDCEVLVLEPHKTLAYAWSALGVETVVTWTLTPTGKGTLLRMEQSGFRPDQPQNYQGAQYGWRKFFGNLEQVLARPD